MFELKSNGKLIIAVLKCYVLVALGVIQQYNIYLKTAIFLKSSKLIVSGLAVAPATWYNGCMICVVQGLMEKEKKEENL